MEASNTDGLQNMQENNDASKILTTDDTGGVTVNLEYLMQQALLTVQSSMESSVQTMLEGKVEQTLAKIANTKATNKQQLPPQPLNSNNVLRTGSQTGGAPLFNTTNVVGITEVAPHNTGVPVGGIPLSGGKPIEEDQLSITASTSASHMFDRMFDNNDTASLSSSSSTRTGNTKNETNKENLDPKLGEVIEDEQSYLTHSMPSFFPPKKSQLLFLVCYFSETVYILYITKST